MSPNPNQFGAVCPQCQAGTSYLETTCRTCNTSLPWASQLDEANTAQGNQSRRPMRSKTRMAVVTGVLALLIGAFGWHWLHNEGQQVSSPEGVNSGPHSAKTSAPGSSPVPGSSNMTKEQFVVACIGQLTSAKTTDDLDRLRLAFGGLAEMFEGGTPDAALKFNRIGAVDYAKMGSSMRLLQQATVTLSEAQDAPDWRKGVLKNKAESELLSARAVVHEETASEAKQFEDKVKTFHDEVTRESRTGRTK